MHTVLVAIAFALPLVIANQAPFSSDPSGYSTACSDTGCGLAGTVVQGTTVIETVVPGTPPWLAPSGYETASLLGVEMRGASTVGMSFTSSPTSSLLMSCTAKFAVTNPTTIFVPSSPPQPTPAGGPPSSWAIITSTVVQVAGPSQTLIYQTPVLTAVAYPCATVMSTLPAVTSTVQGPTITTTSTITSISISLVVPPTVTSTTTWTTTVTNGPPAPSCIPGVVTEYTNIDIYQGNPYQLSLNDD